LSSIRGVGILVGPLVAAPLLAVGPIWVFVLVGGCFILAFPFFLISFRFLVVKPTFEEVSEDEAIN
jgi:hypothetical protein